MGSVRAAIDAHLDSRQVARVIGAIIGMALIVVLQEHPPAPGTVVALLMATAAVGLAELYSEIVEAETRTRHRITREHLHEIAHGVMAVGFGIAFPSVFFVLAALGRWSGDGVLDREVERRG